MKPFNAIKQVPAVFFFVLFFSGSGMPASAADEFPRLTPEDYILPIRKNYKEYTPLKFMEASLLLSGLAGEETGPYIRETGELIDGFQQFLRENGSPESTYKRGGLILDYLHQTIFSKYDEFQTRTDTVLDRGTYNCVSSAVFYAVLAKDIGLKVDTVNTEDHVFCSVRTEEGPIDVETTSLYGFHPGTKREFTDSFGKTGFTYVPPGNYSKREPGDMLNLLSFILQNRIAELQKQKRYFESVGLAVDRYALLGTEKAFQLMITEFINYAASLNTDGNYREGIRFLQWAEERYNAGKAFQDIYATLANNMTILLTDERRFDTSEEYIEKWREEGVISVTYARELKELVYDRKAYSAVNTMQPNEAEKVLDRLYGDGKLNEKRYKEFIVFLYGNRAEKAGRKQSWLKAADIIEQAIAKIGGHPQLLRAYEGYRSNYAVSVHNRFADLYNSKQFRRALEAVEEGLREVPDDGTLRRDLQIVREALSDR